MMGSFQLLFYLCFLQVCSAFVSRFPSQHSPLPKPLKSSSENNDVLVVDFANATEEITSSISDADELDDEISIEDIRMDAIDYGGYSLNGYSSSGYSNDLPIRRRKHQTQEENEDGYRDMFGEKEESFVKKMVKFPWRAVRRMYSGPKQVEPGMLILVRHGESEWNKNKTFTGWSDPDLSVDGVREAEHAARLLLEGGWEIDMVFTSRLKRSIRSAWIILQEMNQVYLPVFKSWRLNERYAESANSFYLQEG